MDERVRQVFRRVFRGVEADASSAPETVPGWDSLAHLALVSELEREFDVELTPDEVLEMVNVRIIEEILAARGVLAEGRS